MDQQAIMQHLEDSGLRCTPQRFGVMSFLAGHTGHPTSAEIFEGVTALVGQAPRPSRATVYNNLRDLVQAGLVREVAVEGRAARYDAKFMQHHHFICDTCGKVEDLAYYAVPKPGPTALGKRIVRECELIVRGICATCVPRKKSLTTSHESLL